MKNIKKVAEIAGLTPKILRDYEKIGLIQPAERTISGYRQYSEDDINRLHRIKYYRTLKFSPQEILFLLDASPEDIRVAMIRHLKNINEQLNGYHYAKAMLCATIYNRSQDNMRDIELNPRVAIVAINLQNEMLEGGALACKRIHSIIPNLQKLFAQARREGIPIIYICDSHVKGDPELLIWDDHMIEGTYGAQIIDAVAPGEHDFIVKKNLFNGFINTDLQNTLDQLEINTLLFTGWRTDVCITQTAVEAFYRGYHVAIAEDGVNTRTLNEHEFGLSLMGVNYDFAFYKCEEAINFFLKREPPEL